MEASNMNEKCQKIFEEMEMLVPNADFMKNSTYLYKNHNMD